MKELRTSSAIQNGIRRNNWSKNNKVIPFFQCNTQHFQRRTLEKLRRRRRQIGRFAILAVY